MAVELSTCAYKPMKALRVLVVEDDALIASPLSERLAGMAVVLRKPFLEADLVTAIEVALDAARGAHALRGTVTNDLQLVIVRFGCSVGSLSELHAAGGGGSTFRQL
jgi:hypothetical protein